MEIYLCGTLINELLISFFPFRYLDYGVEAKAHLSTVCNRFCSRIYTRADWRGVLLKASDDLIGRHRKCIDYVRYVIRYLDFIRESADIFNIDSAEAKKLFLDIEQQLKKKHPGQADPLIVRRIKTYIRRGEARSACRYLGIPDDHVNFLSLPFYETGGVKKKPLGRKDIDIVKKLLQRIKPHQIFAAGDLSDPHGTHRVCFQAVIQACEELKDEPWFKDCRLWMYRGAWQEWDVAEAEMAVPLSPEEVKIKRSAIFRHQSQKDYPLFPGSDAREFWLRAEERNHNTAVIFDKLGMAEYQAIELFVKYKFQ